MLTKWLFGEILRIWIVRDVAFLRRHVSVAHKDVASVLDAKLRDFQEVGNLEAVSTQKKRFELEMRQAESAVKLRVTYKTLSDCLATVFLGNGFARDQVQQKQQRQT